MKNLFNDISQSEKNRILEMHGIKPIISETEQLMTNLKSVTKQQWEKAGSSCFSEAKTPKLYKLLVGAGWGAAAAAWTMPRPSRFDSSRPHALRPHWSVPPAMMPVSASTKKGRLPTIGFGSCFGPSIGFGVH
jgi:hypothetical protein